MGDDGNGGGQMDKVVLLSSTQVVLLGCDLR